MLDAAQNYCTSLPVSRRKDNPDDGLNFKLCKSIVHGCAVLARFPATEEGFASPRPRKMFNVVVDDDDERRRNHLLHN